MVARSLLLSLVLPHVVVSVTHPFNRYATYLPTTRVTDEAALDLDQHNFNLELSERKITEGMYMYTEGGHSGSYAEMKLVNPSAASQDTYLKGTEVVGTSSFSEPVKGILLEDFVLDSALDENFIRVSYALNNSQANYVGCQVGGLTKLGLAVRDGCFVNKGNVTLLRKGADPVNFLYEYNVRQQNKNSLTLQSLSTNAETSMRVGDKYIDEFQTYVNYYGDLDYADKWVTSAQLGTNTGFKSTHGDSDFATYNGRPARAEAMKKGAAYLNVWMEVQRQMHLAVANCKTGNHTAAENSIDKAVVFYAGSQTVEPNNEGILLYALAEVRAHQMKTAGHLDNKDVGDAFVNVQIIQEFKAIQAAVNANSTMCDVAEASRKKIVNYMKVPLVQGVIHYAYLREKEAPDTMEEVERMQAEGATFAATVLPWVHACDSREAKILHDQMKMGAKTNFQTVKTALERSYPCMNIECKDVGGVWDHKDSKYKAYPCGVAVPSDGGSIGSAFASILGISVGVLLAAWVFLRYRKKLRLGAKKDKSMQPMYTGNIAAVTEIA